MLDQVKDVRLRPIFLYTSILHKSYRDVIENDGLLLASLIHHMLVQKHARLAYDLVTYVNPNSVYLDDEQHSFKHLWYYFLLSSLLLQMCHEQPSDLRFLIIFILHHLYQDIQL